MVRTRVIQTLFAYYKNSDKTILSVRKELHKSFADTYDLYFILLDFANELTAYAQQQIEEQLVRARATHSSWVPNRRFVNNRVAQQIFDNRSLRARIQEQRLSWDSGMPVISNVYKQMVESDFYRTYMHAESCSYEDDKRLWRQIYQFLLVGNETLQESLEEMEVALDQEGWTTDMDMVITYVIKTLKRFKEDDTDELPLLDMFGSEEELEFGKNLLQWSIELTEENKVLIAKALQNWEADRIAYMDQIILLVALAEIRHFSEIALEISMNEYIEIAKEYSSDKSYIFINGVLNRIVNDLRADNQLFKVKR